MLRNTKTHSENTLGLKRNAKLAKMMTVLVVEDELSLAQSIELYLRNDGFHTERAADGERALELWRAAQPDLIILDIGLPKLDGLEVLKQVRSESNVPVIRRVARAWFRCR